jgi:hypothetical protein
MDRSPGRKGNQVFSVYKHNASKGEYIIVSTMKLVKTAALIVPSQVAIYNKMLEDSSRMPTGGVEGSAVAAFLNEGIKIQAEQ